MKNFGLIVGFMGFAAIAAAQDMPLQKSTPVGKQLAPRTESIRPVRKADFPIASSFVNPHLLNSHKAAPLRDGFVLSENFEDWDGSNENWLPEGWVVDHKDTPASDRGWKMTKPISLYDYISSKCLTYDLFLDKVDEWVITPEIEVAAGMQLGWSTMTSPYFYDIDFSEAWMNAPEEYPVKNDIRVNISVDGGQTWDLLFSHATELVNETKGNFFAMFNYTMRPFSVSLDDYAGEKVMIGFQIVGEDGNTTFLDDVTVGLPLTKPSYSRPLSYLYFGLSDTDENVPASIMVGPVFKPVTFTNTTRTKDASYTWTYTDTDGEEKTSTDKNLTVTYTTDYTTEVTTRNNMYNYPVLSAVSPTTASDEFSYSGFFQAGGKGEFGRYFTDTQEYEVIDLGLTIIDPMTEGSATYADISVPYFGYNQESDRYWSRYTFGDDYDDNNWNHHEKYADFFYTPETPLVIEGIRTNAYGKISRNAVFTAEIYLLNAGYQISDTPYATATCTGNDITIIDRSSSNDFLSLNFKFDEPIVMTKAVAPYFIVAIGGFRDPENVEYFSPEMSNLSNPNKLGLGWVGSQMCWSGDLLPFSWSPVANYTNDELVAFYIMLDASFPWLEGDEATAQLSPESPATVTLNSFYDGSRLTVEGMPEWMTATATGRYGTTAVTFSATNDAVEGKVTVTVTAPGVSKDITLSVTPAGIGSVEADASVGEAEIFTVDGRRVTDANPAPGIYLRRQGTTVSKVVVK